MRASIKAFFQNAFAPTQKPYTDQHRRYTFQNKYIDEIAIHIIALFLFEFSNETNEKLYEISMDECALVKIRA